MSAYSVRDLKNNPSVLLRELDGGGSAILTRGGEPVGVVIPFGHVVEAGAAAALAVQLVETGAVSLETAARVARRTVGEFIDLLAALNVQDVLTDEQRAREDLATIRGL
jgi:antitoxin (DNA-binding transcriptional repressor) of toxin-antitoxin stability system